MPRILALGQVRRLFSQEVARVNAAQACVRLQHDRRQRRDLQTYLEKLPKPPVDRRPSRDH